MKKELLIKKILIKCKIVEIIAIFTCLGQINRHQSKILENKESLKLIYSGQ